MMIFALVRIRGALGLCKLEFDDSFISPTPLNFRLHPPLGTPSWTTRNIVICCDGTGNEISENISNVLKLYRCLRKTEKTEPRQLVFYDPGVGTLARPNPWRKLLQDFTAIMGLATGYGLDDKVLASYAFLVHNYREGDQIYLFGFSRGAYTVRVLAGLIHKIGLVSPEQVNLAGSGLTSYKQFSSDNQPSLGVELKAFTDGAADSEGPLPVNKDDQAAQFARILSTRWPDGPLRRRLGHGGERDRAAAGPAVLAVPRRARVHAVESEREDVPASHFDRRAPLHVPPEEVGRPADLQARPLQRFQRGGRRTSSRCGSPACIPISAAAIRKRKVGCRNIRCCG